jgi:uncharacterized membrane protein YgdD (TMEM256/DUF423 family)
VLEAFVTGIHAGYLLAGIALLCGSLVALVFLRGDRAAGPSAPAGVAPAGMPARADERP